MELGGAPVLTLDASVLEGEVGSVLRTQAGVTADSAVLANEPVIWSSSDERVATVDENGNITVHAEGTAVITASFAGVTASVTVNGAPERTRKPFRSQGSLMRRAIRLNPGKHSRWTLRKTRRRSRSM